MLQLLFLACLWAHVQALALPQSDDVVGTFTSSNDTSEIEAILRLPSVALPGDLEPYRIYGCTQDQNAALTEILQASRDVLPKVIEDAKLGTQSTHGFTAFFKKTGSTFSKSTNVPQKLLENVLNMDSVPGLYPPFTRKKNRPPYFHCTSPDRKEEAAYWMCQAHPEISAFAMLNTNFIHICPPTWQPDKVKFPNPPSRTNCMPFLRSQNRFDTTNYRRLTGFQSYLMIHEMLHLYQGKNSMGWHTKPPETYDANECVGLSVKDSLRNPMNWQYYLASKDLPRVVVECVTNLGM